VRYGRGLNPAPPASTKAEMPAFGWEVEGSFRKRRLTGQSPPSLVGWCGESCESHAPLFWTMNTAFARGF
jgi:hypothetical protein